MKTFKWPLLILLVLTALALAAYFFGLLPRPGAGHADISVSLNQHDGDNTLHIVLEQADTRTHWRAKSSRYRVDIYRRGPDLYHFQVALIDPDSGRSRELKGAAVVGKEPVTVGGFTDSRGQRLNHDNIVIEAR